MLLALGIIFIIGLSVGAERLCCGRTLGFKKCIVSWRFVKGAAVELFVSILLFSAIHYDYFAVLNMTWYKLCILAAVGLVTVAVSKMLGAVKREKGSKRAAWIALLVVVCVISSELLVFNSRAIQSREYEQVDLLSAGKIEASAKKDNGSYVIEKNGNAVFEVMGIACEIKNIFLDIKMTDSEGEEIPYTVKVEATDKANALYISSIPTRKIYSGSSQYIPMQLRGESDKLKITVTPESSVKVDMRVSNIAINTPRPFDFNLGRVALVLAVVFLVCILLPGSSVYRIKLKDSPEQMITTAAIAGIEIILVFLIISSSSHYLELIAKHQGQYQQLAQSFLNGKLYLEEEVPQFLLEMENPYDYALRRAQGKTFYWDAALYNGHYYVYFGVVPCLLTYLPYYWLTGTALSNDIALFMFAILFIIGCFALIRQIIKRYIPHARISYLAYIVISLLVINGSGLLFMASYADMYSVPIMAALAFTVCGLSFWLSALNSKTCRAAELALGSLCMALVAGCRPNILLFSALAIPFFVGEVILAYKEKRIFKKESIINAIAFALPYVIVAAGMMWYNYSRFGSPFDFGSNYNLTTNDMTSRGFVWERMFPAAFSYLFQLPKMTSTFPFIRFADFDSTYMGVTIRESTYGGIFSYSPLLILLFLIPFIKDTLKKRRVYAPVLILTAIGIATPLLDAQFAGILQRYFADFSLMLYLAAVLILVAIIDRLKDEKHRRYIRIGLLLCVISMVIYQGALVLRVADMQSVLPYMFWY